MKRRANAAESLAAVAHVSGPEYAVATVGDRVKQRSIFLATVAILLPSCGQDEAVSYNNVAVTESALSEEATAPAIVKPNFVEMEDGTYYYVAAVSEDDRKKGKSAGSVSGYRYLGKNGKGQHVLASVSKQGQNVWEAYCSEPCSIVRFADGERIAYDPNSIIGSAFQDAIAGRLTVYAKGSTASLKESQGATEYPEKVSPQTEARTPQRRGDCVRTTIKEISTRLQDSPGSGSAILYENGIYGVDYQTVAEVDQSLVGDPIELCLMSIPKNCPIGDDRGRVYSAINLRTGSNWTMPDASHQCGGA